MTKRKLEDNFDLLIWSMQADCGKKKKFAKFKKALQKAKEELWKIV